MSVAKSIGALAIVVSSVLLAAGVAWAAGQDTASLGGIPVVGWCAAAAFLMQWLAFVPAYLERTERFYDLTGGLTYVVLIAFALSTTSSVDTRGWALALMVVVWACRLGFFLAKRIRASGSDRRFDGIKENPLRFFVAWTLQGCWVFLTACAALAAITAIDPSPLRLRDALGLAVWTLGFGIEVVADRQKSEFRREHPGRFIDTGLWAWSRHPNYFGEITLWAGVAIMASSTLRGWQWLTMISPFFVAFLITRVSGIPMLEQRADERWGDDPCYRRYKSRTPVLIPRPPRS